ncbi:sensor histidine kinase [Inhella gelatinilytica]|uniref:Histidine kinase n=1 Tax=Inhella gelatinilytica TaxID=2795030 RepID=A0A931IVK7_9BURK|nr:histidine kinase [Inhella gelatinilytica]MBH9552969.1 histidine kinase [Inhella gelatinilytica]
MPPLNLLLSAWRRYWRFTPRRADPALPQWLFTLGQGLVAGVLLALFGKLVLFPELSWSAWWLRSLLPTVFCLLSIFICVRLAFRAAERWAPPALVQRLTGRPTLATGAFFAALSISAAAVGWLFAVVVISLVLQRNVLTGSVQAWSGLPLLLASSTALSIVWGLWASHLWRQQQLKTQLTEAQLKLLQAQIEPHFLFNTLANVRSLIDYEPRQAAEMLDLFTEHLRGSLNAMRAELVPLEHELQLVQQYLRLMQLRMCERLSFTIDADPAVRAVPIPPLLLQPLVENAIRHGLECQVAGGRVEILAQAINGRLSLLVRDDGSGLNAPRRLDRKGNGVALANIRERLTSRYGEAAHFSLRPAQPRGTEAHIELPLPALL